MLRRGKDAVARVFACHATGSLGVGDVALLAQANLLRDIHVERVATAGCGESTSQCVGAAVLRSKSNWGRGQAGTWLSACGIAAAGITAVALTSTALADGALISQESQRLTFFFYEKRIRERSTQEKVFQYFASLRDKDGTPMMTPHDLVRAIVHVFPPDGTASTRSGALEGEPRKIDEKEEALFQSRVPPKLYDILSKKPGDGISFQEYLMLFSMRSIDPEAIAAVFSIIDADDSGKMEHDEFESTVQTLLHSTTGCTSPKPRAGKGHGTAGPAEGSKPHGLDGVSAYLFGPARSKAMSVTEFMSFLSELDDTFLELEFNHYDAAGTGRIRAKDLAMSVVSNADAATVRQVLSRIETMPQEMASRSVSQEDFVLVGRVCRHHQRIVSVMKFYTALRDVHGGFSMTRFERAVRKLTGISLPKHVIEILFFVLDLDGSGDLDWAEVQQIMHSKSAGSAWDVSQGSGKASLVECMRSCLRQARA